MDDYEDRQRFIAEKYPKMRPDEKCWEEPDINEKEFREWLHQEFLEKQQETSKKVCAYIQDNATGDESDLHLPQV